MKYIPFIFGVVCFVLSCLGISLALFVGVIGLTLMYLFAPQLLKVKFCYNEPTQFGWFSYDKWLHFVCYIILGFILYGLFKSITMVLVLANIIGFLWELFELTDLWDKICKSKFGKLLHLGSKAACISVKDLVWNNIGILTMIIILGIINS